jgi:GGDEF domain-containing protein
VHQLAAHLLTEEASSNNISPLDYDQHEMLERIGKEIAALSIDIGSGQTIHIAVSMGITLLDVDAPIEQSIEHTDKALYQAKQRDAIASAIGILIPKKII